MPNSKNEVREKIIKIIKKSKDDENYKNVMTATRRDATAIAYEEAGAFYRLVELLRKEFNITADEIKVL